MITGYGATENELQAVFIKMHDWQRLKLTRQTLHNLELLSKKGNCVSVSSVVGKDLEVEVGKSLGLTFGDKAKGTVKPM